MGITIFYHGRLRDLAGLPQLQAELQAVCARLGWPCTLVDERILGTAERYTVAPVECDDGVPTDTFEIYREPVDEHVRGAVIHPPGCETLFLTFGRTGRLVWYNNSPDASAQPGRYGLIQEHLFCKTQFGSPETHIWVCELLRLVEKYASEWEVTDEGDYWGTWNEETLLVTWARYQTIFDALSDPQVRQTILDSAGIQPDGAESWETGKLIEDAPPPWRWDWGVSAGDN
jgi:hypothetical protein